MSNTVWTLAWSYRGLDRVTIPVDSCEFIVVVLVYIYRSESIRNKKVVLYLPSSIALVWVDWKSTATSTFRQSPRRQVDQVGLAAAPQILAVS